MADSPAAVPAGPQVTLQKIYLKDASLEVPLAPQVFTRQWQPQVDVQVNTRASELAAETHQILLSVTVTARLGEDTAYLAEVHQAGIFTLRGFDQPQDKGVVLGAYCPGLLFPFAREAIADLVQRAGFPQLLLQPINFDALYQQHLARQAAAPAAASTRH